MNRAKRSILYIFTIIIATQLTGCNYFQNTRTKENLKKVNLKFTEAMALSMDVNNEKIYSLKDGAILSSGSLSKVQSIDYNIQKKIGVYTKSTNNGINLSNNYVSIDNGGETYNINKSFSYSDVRLSSSGNYLALRSYKNDDIASAEGLGVYSTNGGKKIEFDKKTIVSGNLYRWGSKDTLLYYGIETSQGTYGKIYEYDFGSKSRKVAFDKFGGYCMFFLPLGNGDIIYVENDSNVYNMFYYTKNMEKIDMVTSGIEEIFSSVLDTKNNVIYMLGNDANSSDVALYKYNIITKKLDRLTYDFPSIIDKDGGMAIDSFGKVYFCGMSYSKAINSDMYMYDASKNSVSLITKTQGNYYIISSGK